MGYFIGGMCNDLGEKGMVTRLVSIHVSGIELP